MPLSLFKFLSLFLILLSSSAIFFHGLSIHHPTLPKISSLSPSRKLLSSKFDFTIFLQRLHQHHHRHHHHHRRHHHDHSPEAAEEIDPRYGVEKRLVPTGPNPLHH